MLLPVRLIKAMLCSFAAIRPAFFIIKHLKNTGAVDKSYFAINDQVVGSIPTISAAI